MNGTNRLDLETAANQFWDECRRQSAMRYWVEKHQERVKECQAALQNTNRSRQQLFAAYLPYQEAMVRHKHEFICSTWMSPQQKQHLREDWFKWHLEEWVDDYLDEAEVKEFVLEAIAGSEWLFSTSGAPSLTA